MIDTQKTISLPEHFECMQNEHTLTELQYTCSGQQEASTNPKFFILRCFLTSYLSVTAYKEQKNKPNTKQKR